MILLDIILDVLGQILILEAGYVTAWIVFPLCTIGIVRVESVPFRKVKLGMGSIKKMPGGYYLMEAELASFLGLVFWVLLCAIVYVFI